MNILVIDDCRVHADPNAIHARTTAQGMRMLLNADWDEVWLDNDMDDWDDEVSKTIIPMLEKLWYTDHVKLPIGKFFIHTGNGPAAERMERALDKLPYEYERTFPFAKYFTIG